VLDRNDETPRFSQDVYSATVDESSPRGHSLLRVAAFDLDVGLNADITYRLQDDPDGLLSVDARLGVVSLAGAVDHEASPVVTASVVAQDGGFPRLSSSAQILLRVANVDDEPLAFTQSSYSFSIAENQPAGNSLTKPGLRKIAYRFQRRYD